MDRNDRLVSRVDWGHYLLDHCFVDMIMKAGIDPPPAKQITYRKLKNINLSNFNIDILHEINEFGTMPLDQWVDYYNNTLKEILDRHAPEKTKTLRVSHQQLWFMDKIKHEIMLRRAKERKWLNNPTEYNLNSFYIQCRHVANIMKSAQKEYYIEKITENRTDYKAIFNIANALLFRKEPSLLPSCDSQEQLANDFGQFFHDKIETIMTNLRALPEGTDDYKYVEHDFEMDKQLHNFTTIP